MKPDIYPNTYDLAEVFNNFLNRNSLNSFFQEKGMFFLNARQEEVAKELSKLFYDYEDLEQLRKVAFENSTNRSLSGFNLTSNDKFFNLKDLYERVRDVGHTETKGYSLHALVKHETPTCSIYKGAIKYFKKKPGRIEFLQEEERYTEFYIKDLSKGEWQIEVDGCKSSDGKEVLSLISTITKYDRVEISSMDINALSIKDTIVFFDELAQKGMDDNWRFSDTKQLTFRKRKNNSDIVDDEEVEEEKEAKEEQLSGITQAILEGKNLRENPFVKQSEESGYIFTAMTYEYEHKKRPITIQLRAEFKGNPKIFEVSIVDYLETEGLNAESKNSTIDSNSNRIIRSDFWNNAKDIYNNLSTIQK